MPELPAEPEAVYAGGTRTRMPIDWQEIAEEQVTETDVEPFVVDGSNRVYGRR